MLLVIGDANVEVTGLAPRLPQEGEEVPFESPRWSGGGAGVRVAASFARLGGRARLLCRVGTDAAAEMALSPAAACGVDLEAVQRDPEHATGVTLWLASTGTSMAKLRHKGANALLAPPPGSVWDGVRYQHVCGRALLPGRQRETALALTVEACSRGVPVSLDLCPPLLDHARGDLPRLWPSFAVIFASPEELHRLAFGETASPSASAARLDEAVAWLMGQGARTVVVKSGATYLDGAPRGTSTSSIGTLGAALTKDAFVAGYLFACMPPAPEPAPGGGAAAAASSHENSPLARPPRTG